jgi:hypothetical protein
VQRLLTLARYSLPELTPPEPTHEISSSSDDDDDDHAAAAAAAAAAGGDQSGGGGGEGAPQPARPPRRPVGRWSGGPVVPKVVSPRRPSRKVSHPQPVPVQVPTTATTTWAAPPAPAPEPPAQPKPSHTAGSADRGMEAAAAAQSAPLWSAPQESAAPAPRPPQLAGGWKIPGGGGGGGGGGARPGPSDAAGAQRQEEKEAESELARGGGDAMLDDRHGGGGLAAEQEADDEVEMDTDYDSPTGRMSSESQMNMVWKGSGGSWAPVGSGGPPESDDSAAEQAMELGELTLELESSADSSTPSVTPPRTAESGQRRVNVGEEGSTPKEVREYVQVTAADSLEAQDVASMSAWELLSMAPGSMIAPDGMVEPVETLRGGGGPHPVALYFGGAHDWGCHAFEEELRELYTDGGCEYEVLYCGLDPQEDEQSFEEHRLEMPWRVLPHADGRAADLAQRFGVTWGEVPVLMLMDEDGECADKDGVARVRAGSAGHRASQALAEGEAALAGASEAAAAAAASDDPTGSAEEAAARAAFAAHLAFERGLRDAPDHVQLLAGAAIARKKLPRPLEQALPCLSAGWHLNTLTPRSSGDQADTSPPMAAGQPLLLAHAETGVHVCIWEDSPGFFFRSTATSDDEEEEEEEEWCISPQYGEILPLAELAGLLTGDRPPPMVASVHFPRAGGGGGGGGGGGAGAQAGGGAGMLEPGVHSWGAQLQLSCGAAPWVVRSDIDGGLLLTDLNWQGGALFLAPDGGIAFANASSSVVARRSPRLGGCPWTQGRVAALLARAQTLSEPPLANVPWACFGAQQCLREGLELVPSHPALSEALGSLQLQPDTRVRSLQTAELPVRLGRWCVAERPSPGDDGRVQLLLSHPRGLQLALGPVGGIAARLQAGAKVAWERSISDLGWQDRGIPAAAAAGGLVALPTADEFAAAMLDGARVQDVVGVDGELLPPGAGVPVLGEMLPPGADDGEDDEDDQEYGHGGGGGRVRHPRLLWSGSGHAEQWAVLCAPEAEGEGEEAGSGGELAITNVSGWSSAWVAGMPHATLRLLDDGGAIFADAEGGWTGLCITPGAVQLTRDEG